MTTAILLMSALVFASPQQVTKDVAQKDVVQVDKAEPIEQTTKVEPIEQTTKKEPIEQTTKKEPKESPVQQVTKPIKEFGDCYARFFFQRRMKGASLDYEKEGEIILPPKQKEIRSIELGKSATLKLQYNGKRSRSSKTLKRSVRNTFWIRSSMNYDSMYLSCKKETPKQGL